VLNEDPAAFDACRTSDPEKTLQAFAEHGALKGTIAVDGGDCDALLARFAQAGAPAHRSGCVGAQAR
jgi:transaldolase